MNKKYLRIFGLVLFTYFISRISFKELILVLRGINFCYLFLALFLWLVAFFVRFFQWKILVGSQDKKISLIVIFKTFITGLSWGTITPGRLGEMLKAKYLVDYSKISTGEAFFITLFERIVEFIIILSISFVSILTLFFFYKIKIGWLLTLLILPLILIALYFFKKRGNLEIFLRYLIKIFTPESQKEKLNSFFNNFREGLIKVNLSIILKLLGSYLIYYLLAVSVNYFLMLSLGLEIPFLYLFLIVALVWMILIIPITILGLGSREASYIFFFSRFGINLSQVITFSLLILFFNLIVAIPGAIQILKE